MPYRYSRERCAKKEIYSQVLFSHDLGETATTLATARSAGNPRSGQARSYGEMFFNLESGGLYLAGSEYHHGLATGCDQSLFFE